MPKPWLAHHSNMRVVDSQGKCQSKNPFLRQGRGKDEVGGDAAEGKKLNQVFK